MASGKNALKIKQRFKNDITKTYYYTLVMLLRTLYVRSNKPNASKFAL